MDLQEAISKALNHETERQHITFEELRQRINMTDPDFYARVNNREPWSTSEIDALAKALGYINGWALFEYARIETEYDNKLRNLMKEYSYEQ